MIPSVYNIQQAETHFGINPNCACMCYAGEASRVCKSLISAREFYDDPNGLPWGVEFVEAPMAEDMTMRDLFAAMAIEVKANPNGSGAFHPEALARDAYAIADAMMRERQMLRADREPISGK